MTECGNCKQDIESHMDFHLFACLADLSKKIKGNRKSIWEEIKCKYCGMRQFLFTHDSCENYNNYLLKLEEFKEIANTTVTDDDKKHQIIILRRELNWRKSLISLDELKKQRVEEYFAVSSRGRKN